MAIGLNLDPEGPVSSSLTKFANIALINVWFIVCSIPIFTIGASFTAMMDVAWRMTKNREGTGITKAFFHAFKVNFKKGTLIWLIQLVFIALLYVDYRIIGHQMNLKGGAEMAAYIVFGVLVLIVAFTSWYSLTLTAIFDNTVIQTIKNGLLISIARFPWSLLIACCYLSPLILLIIPARTAFFCVPFLLLVWFGAAALGAAYLFRHALAPFLPEGYDETPVDEIIPDEDLYPDDYPPSPDPDNKNDD